MNPRRQLLGDLSRCHGDADALICHTCARREQIAHDDPVRYYPSMDGWPGRDGTCLYWIKEVKL